MKLLISFFAYILFALPAFAAFKSEADSISPEKAWNPVPLSDDVILPMPCNRSLALRAVAVPQGALIRDKRFAMGIANAKDQERQIYERQFYGHIAAPFTAADLPASWRKKLDTDKDTQDSWYFIGKYEISRMQWDAVMEALDREGNENPALCPKNNLQGSLPVADVSWFEAQEFLNKYNAWLIKNHAKSLPSFGIASNIAFLRLPTEEEWEYAARGGNKVPPEWWADNDIYKFAEGKSLKDYAVTSGEGARDRPASIGSREANPLGIHDAAGNVSEMVDGFFRMSIPDMVNGKVIRRLHGASGGILTKGGGYRSFAEAVMPGARDEIPLYTSKGPGRAADLGFRIVLAGLNIPNAKRLAELRKEASSQIPKAEPTVQISGDTPLEIVQALEKNADANLKESLKDLSEMLSDQEAARAGQDLKNLEQSLRSLLYQSETLRAFAFRYLSAAKQVARIKDMLEKQLDQQERLKAQQVISAGEKDIDDYMQSLQMGANYYKSTLDSISQESEKEVNRLLAQFAREYGSGTIFDKHMSHNLEVLKKNIEIARKRGASGLSSRAILKGILPESHYESLKF